MRTSGTPLRVPGRWAAAAVAAALVALSIAGALVTRADVQREDRARDKAVARASIAALERAAAAATTTSAHAASLASQNASLAGVLTEIVPTAVFANRRDDQAVVSSAAGEPLPGFAIGDDLTSLPEVAEALRAVRDTGTPRATALLTRGDEQVVAVVHPWFGPGAIPADTEQRRARLTGWSVTSIQLDRLVAPSLQDDLGLRVIDMGSEVYATGGAGGTIVADAQIVFVGRSWKIEFLQGGGDHSGLPWLVLAVGLAIALLAFLLVAWLTRVLQDTAAAGDRRAVHLERVTQGGRVLHQSLDLEELLPAFATVAAEVVPLAHLSVRIDDAGAPREVFRTGQAVPSGQARATAPHSKARAGDAFEISLTRGWRTVGSVVFVATRAVDEDEMLSLHAIADVLAAALANAEVLRREKENVQRLAEVDRLKDSFLGTVSHELRTSVTAVTGFADLLAHKWDSLTNAERREFARRVGRNASSLGTLVDQLLDFARLEQGTLRVTPVHADLAALVRAALDQLDILLASHVVVADLEAPVAAYVDPEVVERVLANLLSNAAKYAPPGSGVTVSTGLAGEQAELVVADQGPGVRHEDRALIFTRFYRGDSPVAVATRGAGIGLAVVRELVERSWGTVRVEDAEGGGARFVVRFPTGAPAEVHENASVTGGDPE